MYKITTTFFSLLFFTVVVVAQKTDNNKSILIDQLECRYYCSEYSIYSKSAKSEYRNTFLGRINYIDISNPLKILVFFKDANAVVFLNNELSLLGEIIYLDELGINDIDGICSSNTNGFWVYNKQKCRIEYYDEALSLKHFSYKKIDIELPNHLISLQTDGKLVYLSAGTSGIYIFDMFANYIKTLPIKSANCIQIINNNIAYSQNNNVLLYQSKMLQTDTLFKNNKKIDYFRIYNNNLYYSQNDSLIKTCLIP